MLASPKNIRTPPPLPQQKSSCWIQVSFYVWMNRIDRERPCSINCLLGCIYWLVNWGRLAAILDTDHWSLKPENSNNIITDTNKKALNIFSDLVSLTSLVLWKLSYFMFPVFCHQENYSCRVDSEVVHLVFLLHFEELAKDASPNKKRYLYILDVHVLDVHLLSSNTFRSYSPMECLQF